eukprot:CAMPEP_0197697908 /NCGR_PEP_ID=MMETSP1338-20131121/118609_1 /TAXON_ID=43686 ORGANISM="Pelagodinium beii, Strain RCC1491" /NCGR_SAMPLE_ID=MMETSP1338 /ASSEMBLY_ACC=CAM_ASM_000754 /LENGTH=80 /DNA_ID=CAMNT_0043281207 /DNA_START=1 /DNA_END=240 /DNA_ORIENTATION=-
MKDTRAMPSQEALRSVTDRRSKESSVDQSSMGSTRRPSVEDAYTAAVEAGMRMLEENGKSSSASEFVVDEEHQRALQERT